MADHIFDETTDVSAWAVGMEKIKAGDIVFLGTEVQLINFFHLDRFNKIRHPFALITHNSDASVPTSAFRWVLEHEKILVWFASNPDYVHHKLVAIPIGLANSRWAHGDVKAFKRAVLSHRRSFEKRTTLLYVNFEVKNNIKVRTTALQWARQIPNVSIASFSSLENYLEQLGNAKFVLSPPGNGLDCHRTWEAILMGAIPIVLRSSLDPLFFNTPILIVDDWSYLNIEYLQSLTHDDRFNPLLLAEYWYERITNTAKNRLFSDKK